MSQGKGKILSLSSKYNDDNIYSLCFPLVLCEMWNSDLSKRQTSLLLSNKNDYDDIYMSDQKKRQNVAQCCAAQPAVV